MTISNVYCVFVLLLKYNLTILVLMSTHHIHPPLCCYARLRVWAPPFRNSGSTPDYILTLLIVNCIVPIVGYAESAYSNSYHLSDLSSTEYT